jgi:hypothetical protein
LCTGTDKCTASFDWGQLRTSSFCISVVVQGYKHCLHSIIRSLKNTILLSFYNSIILSFYRPTVLSFF